MEDATAPNCPEAGPIATPLGWPKFEEALTCGAPLADIGSPMDDMACLFGDM